MNVPLTAGWRFGGTRCSDRSLKNTPTNKRKMIKNKGKKEGKKGGTKERKKEPQQFPNHC